MNGKTIKLMLTYMLFLLLLVSSFTPISISQIKHMDQEILYEKLNLDRCYISEATNNNFQQTNTFKSIPTVSSESSDKSVRTEQMRVINSGLINSSWPMKCHDTHHTGRSPHGTTDNPYDELWRYESNYIVDADPSIGADGTIYVGGGYDGLPWYLFAIYPNGTLRWSYYAEGLIKHMCPAIAEDGTIYIGAWDNSLHAVNPDGTSKWEFGTGCNIVSDPIIGEDGTIYFGTFTGPWINARLYAINPNGTEKWHYETGDDILSDPAIGDDGTIYFGSDDRHLYALYPNGTLRWNYETGDWVDCPPSIAEDGTIYFASRDGYLYALYPNGTLRWKTYTYFGSDTNPSIGSDGTIYICSASKLFAVSPNNGDIDWKFDFGGTVMQSSSAICADGIIYTGIEIGDRDGGEIVAVNPDGTERWRERLSNFWVDSSPCIGSDGTIYISSASFDDRGERCHLHAFGKLDPNAPEAPTIIGETDGRVGVEYEYTFCTTDPNGDDVCYYVEWGDGEITDWTDAYESGEDVVLSHTWDDRGTYIIRARAKDTDNLWGPWGELEVKMPVNQQSSDSLFHWFLERFPNAFPILRYLLGL